MNVMGALKSLPRKKRLIHSAKKKNAPLWANIRKLGLKRIRTRRIRVARKNWRSGGQLKL